MISEAITSSFHKGLLRGPKSRKGLEATKGIDPMMTEATKGPNDDQEKNISSV